MLIGWIRIGELNVTCKGRWQWENDISSAISLENTLQLVHNDLVKLQQIHLMRWVPHIIMNSNSSAEYWIPNLLDYRGGLGRTSKIHTGVVLWDEPAFTIAYNHHDTLLVDVRAELRCGKKKRESKKYAAFLVSTTSVFYSDSTMASGIRWGDKTIIDCSLWGLLLRYRDGGAEILAICAQ